MWRAFPEVLMVDTTYNTNMYDWPLVQFIGVTSTSQSFCIAAAFVIRERQRNFGWALEKLKQMLYDCKEPRVILTDADQALMNACDAVFPNATKNLCRWHISENIRRKFKGLYSTEMGTDFAYWWKVLYQSPTIQEYDHLNVECHLIRDDRAVGLGIHEKVWPDIRRAMQNELETNEGWWRAMFNKEDDRLYGWVHSSIPYYNTVKPAPPSRWFSLPGHGHVAAQTYACVLVNLVGNQAESYFPLRIGPDLVPDSQVIGIASWGGDHRIYINLVGDFPMLRPNPNWERSAVPAALEWKTRFGQRLKDYEDIRQGWRRESSNVDLNSL
ncbi:uncharacterized protein LOC143530729 [Bidens hawaiensis]|uniref:uncharacterized protein LOC143530729 n=1 Tax=Bidens hawaiensis TaxID=980011 RepID=UPI00404B43A8